MRQILVFFLLLSGILSAATMAEIKGDERYLCGEGWGNGLEVADRQAINDLLSQISVKVESSFRNEIEETNGIVNEECQLQVKTYSSAKLYNAERLVDEESYAPEVYVLRYILRDQLNNIFRERKSRVNSLIVEGELAEGSGNIADALRNYYWAYALLPTIPGYQSLTYYFGERGESSIYTGLENKLNIILSEINFTVIDKRTEPESNFTDIIVKAEYKAQPACGLLVYYNDGHAETTSAKWSTGKGKLRLGNDIAETSSEINLYIDYSYRNHAFDGDVISAIDELDHKILPAAAKRLDLGKEPAKTLDKYEISVNNSMNCPEELFANIRNSLDEVAALIRVKDFGRARKYFTAKGYQDFNKLIDYGNGEILEKKLDVNLVEINGLYELRSLPMAFSFKGHNEPFTERVNMIYNQSGKIEKLTFALSDAALEDICDSANFSDNDRGEIIHFMELYKTAYCLKDISFLENVFTEDALIILGNVIHKDPDYNAEGMLDQLGGEKVQYIRQSKGKFIERLSKQFSEKEFINLHFTETNMKRLSKSEDNIYGIQISQYYYSSDYADHGYLFLSFNLNDPDKPRITVRSWQPEKFDDGTIVGLGDFRF